MLEIAELAVRIGKIPQRAAARFNRGREHVFYMGGEGVRLRDLQPARRAARGDARAVERFADIYIAEPRHDALVEQGGFNLGLFALEGGAQNGSAKAIPQRFRPNAIQAVGLARADQAP